MRIIDIVNGPWAIRPTMLQEIQRIYASHLHRSEKLDLAAVEAATGKRLDNSQNGSYITEGVAVIPMHGVIGKRMNLLTQVSGGVSTEVVANDFLAALDNSEVKGIVFDIDSPGGTVDGTSQLADIIAANKGRKPVVACANGMMCSAAYWIGSAADSINMADLTTDVGSIGVVAGHMDISKWEEKQGVKTTEITAGRFKRATSQYQALTDEGRAMIQSEVDQIYGLFTEAVAINRGVSIEEVLTNMADGRVFLGQKALDAGLVDSVSTLAETIQQVSGLAATHTAGRHRASAALTQPAKELNSMSRTASEMSGGPMCGTCACATCACAEGDCATCSTRPGAQALAAAHATGAAAENQRIKDVRAQLIPGHEALVESLAFDGKTTGAEAAMAIIGAEKSQRVSAAAALDDEAPPVVPAVVVEEDSGKIMKRAAFSALSPAAQREALAAGNKIVD